MGRTWIKLLLLLAALLVPSYSISACKTDCRDQYDSEREDCLSQYEDPDEADDLQACLQDAKAAYEDCIEECES